jgi:Domain of unknown function (DUF6968)
MKPKPGRPIVRRRYFDPAAAKRTVVEVEIDAPAKSPKRQDEFMCSLRIKAPVSNEETTVYGVDEMQALLLALGYVKSILHRLDETLGLSLCWVGGDAADFGIRIPKFTDTEMGDGGGSGPLG